MSMKSMMDLIESHVEDPGTVTEQASFFGLPLEWVVEMQDLHGKSILMSVPSYELLARIVATRRKKFTKEELEKISGYKSNLDSYLLDLAPYFLSVSDGKYHLNTVDLERVYITKFRHGNFSLGVDEIFRHKIV